ncbi:MAG: helix-turn-helix domain-containing protein [Waddliaceae bacterium]
MNKKWSVHLRAEERVELEKIVKKGKSPARVIRRAQMLLFADEGKADREISSLLRCSESSVYNTRRAYCEKGLKQALSEKARSGRPEKLVGKAKSHLIALACSEPPEGRSCWTMQLLADRCVTLELTDSISDETIRRTLKKMK